MKNDTHRHGNARLRSLLRRCDPAGDGADPSPAEIAAWRRAILDAARPSAAPVRLWLWGAAALAAVAVLLLVLVGPRMLRPEPAPAEPLRNARTAPLPARPAPSQETESPPSDVTTAGRSLADSSPDGGTVPVASPDPSPSTVAAVVPAVTIDAQTRPAAPGTLDTAGAAARGTDRSARVIHFTAPGGTRIIWRLDPRFSLPRKGEKT
jgi:hypothetical protein